MSQGANPSLQCESRISGGRGKSPVIEKFAYVLAMASWKLRPYFEAHKVTVLTDQPLKNVFQRLDASRWLLK